MLTLSIKHKTLIADTIAMIVFPFVTSMFLEIVVSGLTFSQSLTSRLLSIPLNLVTGRPYGMFRDWFFRVTKGDQG